MEVRFCPLCAAPLAALAAGSDEGRPACPEGHFVHYDNPAVTTMAFIERDGTYLVLRRADEPYAGGWDLPGGFVEADEHPRDCIRREIREETGLEVELGAIVGVYSSRYGDDGKTTVDIAYRARAASGAVTLSAEKTASAWLGLADLPQLAFAGEREALADLREQAAR